MEQKDINAIVALAKRRGFIFPSSEIYGGISNAFDYGPLGVEMKNNIKNEWWKMFVRKRQNIVGLDASIIMNPKVWEASGHVAEFSDPLVEDVKTHKRYRLDHLLEEHDIDITGMSIDEMSAVIEERGIKSPDGNALTNARHFNMLFQTHIGTTEETTSTVYLRPETAQAMFVDFKNIVSSSRVSLPFGVAQIGKAFRNEITPRNFIFRTREFEQMEIEYFVRASEWEEHFEEWLQEMDAWIQRLGLKKTRIHRAEIPEGERAHYSQRTVDIEYDFPFGRKELYGLAYRGDYDLQQHASHSNETLVIVDAQTNEKVVPHTIEPTFGVERTLLAVLVDGYTEEVLENDTRIVLKIAPWLSPYTVAVFPLVANDSQMRQKATTLWGSLSGSYSAFYDQSGAIGKRYRRQDEIGTPLCVTIDGDSLQDDTATLRDRDSMEQVRVQCSDISRCIHDVLQGLSFADIQSRYSV